MLGKAPEERVHPHRNQQLFSDHYLDIRLPNTPAWQALQEEALGVQAALKKLRAKFVPTQKEAQLENDYVRPILQALGHEFLIQPSLSTSAGVTIPDYVFFSSVEALNTAKHETLHSE